MFRKRAGKKRRKGRIVLLSLLALVLAAGWVFTRLGGFDTGESADPAQFAAYAGTVADIDVPQSAAVIALGEATHGNAEFQQLKLDVFRHLVENEGVRALALEGDCGGCEQVNRYIHGGEGTAREAAQAIGFAIYRTEEMAALIAYMRQYNDRAAEGDDLRFYGFDMQRCGYSLRFLLEASQELGVETGTLETLAHGEEWSDEYDAAARAQLLTRLKTELEGKQSAETAIHFADILLQNGELLASQDSAASDLRDRFMAENILWAAEQERLRGFSRLFVTGHNMHVGKFGYDNMGKLLQDQLGERYYAIGTGFYKTTCNLPSGSSGRRTRQVFYAHDPLAKAAKLAGLRVAWLDFAKVPQSSGLWEWVSGYHYMGSLGERYSLLLRLLPPSYRIFQSPAALYNGMIFVSEATPTTILDME